MRCLRILVFVFLLSSFAFSQELTRTEKVQKINDLRSQIGALEKDILQPDAKDTALAAKQGLNAIRLMPREKYENVLAIRGGGAYYSFAFKRQEYGRGSDIGLEQGYLSVGFAGADYGFIYDLGESPLSAITKNSGEAFFLLNYKPPAREADVRSEARKAAYDYDVNGLKYSSRLTAAVGHSYLLRSISFDDSDILVAFTVTRKDADGSLIIFWKTIESFEKPTFVREQVAEK
jgi:hypothetical protein